MCENRQVHTLNLVRRCDSRRPASTVAGQHSPGSGAVGPRRIGSAFGHETTAAQVHSRTGSRAASLPRDRRERAGSVVFMAQAPSCHHGSSHSPASGPGQGGSPCGGVPLRSACPGRGPSAKRRERLAQVFLPRATHAIHLRAASDNLYCEGIGIAAGQGEGLRAPAAD